MARVLFVVARDRSDVYQYLTREFSNREVIQVLLDRRFDQRRQGCQAPSRERRASERRTGADLGTDLRTIGWSRVVAAG